MTTGPLDEISKTLSKSDRVKKQLRDENGKFIKTSDTPGVDTQVKKDDYPPMVSLEVANPVTYLKLWWKKVMAKEGIDVKLRIHPVTAIILALIICGAGYGLGRLTFPADSPIVRYVPKLGPSPTTSPWKTEAYAGVVQKSYSTGKYYLVTTGTSAISLDFPANVNAEKLLGKRILAVGKYNTSEEVLYVTDASDLELLPLSVTPVPTITTPPVTLVTEQPTPTIEVPPQVYNPGNL